MSVNAGSVMTGEGPPRPGSVRSRLWGLFVLTAVGALAVGIWAGVRTDSSSAERKSQPSGDRASAPAVTTSAFDATKPQASITGVESSGQDQLKAAPVASEPRSEGPQQDSPNAGPAGGGLLSNVLKPFDNFGKPLDAHVVAADKQAAVPGGIAGLPACFVTDGDALESAVMGTTCTVIILRPPTVRSDFKIRNMMVVRSLKVLIGNPVRLPVVNATNRIVRLFDVQDGGFLDLRSIYMIRGAGYPLDDDHMALHMGSCVRVLPGGQFVGYGAVFRTVPRGLQFTLEQLAQGPRRRQRNFGGHVLVIAGAFYCFGCMTLHINYFGNPWLNLFQMGSDYLVVGGTLTCVGCFSVHYTLFTNSINIGNLGACVGGAMTYVGGGVVSTAILNAQWVYGNLMFVAGGSMVSVGLTDQAAFVAIARAGMGVFTVAAGVQIHVGLLENRAWGVGSMFVCGQTYVTTAGILQMHESEIVTTQISLIQAGQGLNSFVGSGELTWVNCVYGSFGLTMSQHGLGMRWAVDVGYITLIYTETVTALLVRAQFILGSDAWMGAGHFTQVNATRLSIQLVNAAFGGYEVWVGGGSAVFIRTHVYGYRLINFKTNPFGWSVGGTIVPEPLPGGEDPYQGDPIYVDGGGVTPLSLHAFSTNSSVRPSNGSVFRSSLIAIDGHAEFIKSSPPALALFRSELRRGRRLEGQSADSRAWRSTSPLSARGLVSLWKRVMAQQQQQQRQQEVQPQQQKEVERWPEYYYAPANKADCFICGITPSPAESFVAPASAQICTGWLNETRLAKALPKATPPNRTLQANATGRECRSGAVTAAASSCVASDACAGSKTLAQAVATAKAASPKPLRLSPLVERMAAASDGGDETSTLLDTTLLWIDLVVYCSSPSGSACDVTPQQAEAAVLAYLSGLAERQGNTDVSFKVTVSSAAVPKALHVVVGQEYLDSKDADVPLYSDQCQGMSRFNVFLTTHDQPKKGAALAPTEEERLVLFEAIKAQVQDSKELCGVHTASKNTLHLPSLKKPGGMEYYQSQSWRGPKAPSVLAWPSVKLLSGGDINPVETVIAGNGPYHILLDDFPAGVEVVVKLMRRMPFSGDTGIVIDTLTVPAASAGDRHRRVRVEWTAEALDDAGLYDRKFFVLAQQKDVPLLMAFSPAFRYLPAGSTGRRRKATQWGQ